MSLKELYQKVQMKKNLEMKLNELRTQKGELSQKEADLKRKMLSEQDDVERLENGGLASFFYELIGTKDQKLEKERQEAHEAKSKYNTVVYQLMSLEKDIARYESQMKKVADSEMEYHRLMENVLNKMKDTDPHVISLEERIVESQSDQTEIIEAKLAGQAALNKAKEAMKSLDSAGGWSTYDLLGGGALSDIMKYAKLNEAERQVQQLQVLLGQLKTELADVQVEVDVQIAVGEFMMVADFFFDNLFTDYAVKNKISNAKSQMEFVIDQIQSVMYQLDDLLQMEQQREKDLQSKMESYAVEHQGVNS